MRSFWRSGRPLGLRGHRILGVNRSEATGKPKSLIDRIAAKGLDRQKKEAASAVVTRRNGSCDRRVNNQETGTRWTRSHYSANSGSVIHGEKHEREGIDFRLSSGREPNVFTGENNSKVARVAIAHNERTNDESGTVKEETRWFQAVGFGPAARFIEENVYKGSSQEISGAELHYSRAYTGKTT